MAASRAARGSVAPVGERLRASVISAEVNVPVLSVHSTVIAPRSWIDASRFTITLRLAIRIAPRDNVTVVVVDVADDVPDSAATTATTPPSDATTIGAPRSSRVRRLVAAFAAVVIVAASAIAVTGWYARGGYFVGFDGRGDDAVLVVFKGRPQQILWFSPTVRVDTGVTRAEVFPALAADIDDEPEYDSLARARAYVESIRGVVEAQRDVDETGS